MSNPNYIFHPFEVGTRFRIIPPEAPPSTDGRIDLVISKGAFGSGEHETTASCLEILETLPAVRHARVLDLGCGTGILGIAALKLAADSVLGVDINPQAVETALRNCQLNGVDERAQLLTGVITDVKEKNYDLVLANIYGDLLLDLAGDLVARTRPGGHLLLSGMLWEYNFDVRKRYEGLGCAVLKNRMLPEFSTVLLKKR